MSEPHEPRDEPVGPDFEESGPAGEWRNVPKPTTEELVTPSVPATVDAPRIPLLVKVVGLVLVALLLLLAAWLGLTLGSSDGETAPTPTQSIDETLWHLDPPVTLGKLVQGETTSTPAGTQGDRDIVRADYSDGSAKVVLLLSRPEDDLSRYLEDAGVEDVESVGESSCGISVDNKKVPVCARVVDDTAIAVAGLTDQEFEDLASLVDSFYRAMK